MNNEMILIVLLCVCAGLAVELTGLRAWRMLALPLIALTGMLLLVMIAEQKEVSSKLDAVSDGQSVQAKWAAEQAGIARKRAQVVKSAVVQLRADLAARAVDLDAAALALDLQRYMETADDLPVEWEAKSLQRTCEIFTGGELTESQLVKLKADLASVRSLLDSAE